MIIGGLQKFSLLDYPEHVSAIIFTQGCNFRCGFCYNPMLVLRKLDGKIKGHPLISEDDLFDFLKTRVGKLDGVVITGGEPTLHKDLPEFLKKIKDLRFKIKVDTNGTNPDMFKKLIDKKLIDYIAMDIKGPLSKYSKITRISENQRDQRNQWSNIRKSVKIIMESDLPYEFRTTVVPGLAEKKDIPKIGEIIKGARVWYLQGFKSDTELIDNSLRKIKPYSDKEMEEMCKTARKCVKRCEVR